MLFDPHTVKINIDGHCRKNPGGSGGLGVRTDYGCNIDCECEAVEYRCNFETNSQRMELRSCIFVHEWIADNTDDLGGGRCIILTDSSYVYGGYSWVIDWVQTGCATRIGRLMKIPTLWKDLMTLRRKLSRCARIEVKPTPRRSDESAKEVDRSAKAAGRLASNVDCGFQRNTIGRSKNNSKTICSALSRDRADSDHQALQERCGESGGSTLQI